MVWNSGLTGFHARGTLRSLKNPDELAWIAFEMKYKKNAFHLDLRNSHNPYRLLADNLHHPSRAEIFMNGQNFGQLEKSGREITLTEDGGYRAGVYHRFDESKPSGIMGLLSRSWYGSVELKGRSEFNLCLYICTRPKPLGQSDQQLPVIKNLLWRPTEIEEHWVMALIGWEVLKSAGHTIMYHHNTDLD
jgi:hypothetical protein